MGTKLELTINVFSGLTSEAEKFLRCSRNYPTFQKFYRLRLHLYFSGLGQLIKSIHNVQRRTYSIKSGLKAYTVVFYVPLQFIVFNYDFGEIQCFFI